MTIQDDGPGVGGSVTRYTQRGYPAARVVAARVHLHFAQHLNTEDGAEDCEIASCPDIEAIEEIIDVAFWASLHREESYTPRLSLAFVSPAQVNMPLILERPVPLASHPLARLGPAVDRPGIHLCVWRNQGDLRVWGAARNLPRSCFVLEVVAPGLLVIKHSGG